MSTSTLVVVGIVEAVLLVIALVCIYKAPAGKIVGLPKWAWVILAAVFTTVGPLLAILFARSATAQAEKAAQRPTTNPEETIDDLYKDDRLN